VAKRELAELKKEARQLSTVVAAKAALENKVQELEWRLSAENKIKKKVEKENAQLRDELDELRRALRDVKLADERRGKEEDERRARKEKAGREQARNHEKELDELRARLAEEAERSAGLARELAELREARERDRVVATASQAESEEAQRLREENERMKELMREMEEKMEADEEDYEAKILELHRELEKLRFVTTFPCVRVVHQHLLTHDTRHTQNSKPANEDGRSEDGDASEADQRLFVDQDHLRRERADPWVPPGRQWRRLAAPARRTLAHEPVPVEPAQRGRRGKHYADRLRPAPEPDQQRHRARPPTPAQPHLRGRGPHVAPTVVRRAGGCGCHVSRSTLAQTQCS
jgi:hypothetical protein